jgi:hypothetical protein
MSKTLCCIVNGETCAVSVGERATVGLARKRALNATHNNGRPAEEWEIRESTGRLLPSHTSARGLKDGAVLFIGLPVGVGA